MTRRSNADLQFREIIGNERIGVWQWNLAEDEVVLSRELLLMIGRTEDSDQILSLDTFFDLTHSEDRNRVDSERNKLIHDGIDSQTHMYRLKHRDCGSIMVEERIRTKNETNGSISFLHGCVIQRENRLGTQNGKLTPNDQAGAPHNATMQPQPKTTYSESPTNSLVASATESARVLASLSKSIPVAIFRMSEIPFCSYVNEQWTELTKRPATDALGKGWMRFVHRDDLAELLLRWERFANDSSLHVAEPREVRQILPDGTYSWILCTFAKELDNDNNVTGYVGTLTDTQQFNQARGELARLNSQLREILEASAIGTWEYSFNDDRLIWDKQMLQIFGIEADDFDGSYKDWSTRLHPDDFTRMTLEKYPNSPIEGTAKNEFRIVRPSGETRHIYSTIHYELDQNSQPIHASGINMDVTERREAERVLLESRDHFQRIAERIPGLVLRVVRTADGIEKCTYASDKCVEILGVEASELIANFGNWQRLVHADDLPMISRAINDSGINLSPLEVEFRTVQNDKTRWIAFFAQPDLNPHGVLCWDGVALDITDRKEAEMELNSIRQEIDLINENIPGTIFRWVMRSDGTAECLYTSSKTKEMFGVEPQKVLEDINANTRYINQDDLRDIEKGLKTSVQDVSPDIHIFRVNLPNEDTRWYETHSQPTRMPNGDILFDGVVLDVTDRKLTELALEKTKSHLANLTENIPGMVFQLLIQADGSQKYSYLSPRSKSMFGVEFSDVEKDPQAIWQFIHSEDVPRIQEGLSRMREQQSAFNEEYRVTLPNEGIRWYHAVGFPQQGADDALEIYGIVLDVTDRKEAELANEALTAATRAKDEFLATISHELRTPLNAILATTEGMQLGLFENQEPDAHGNLKIIEQSGLHLLELINELLDLTKIEAGQMQLSKSAVDVADLCETTLRLVEHKANQKNLKIRKEIPMNLPMILADEKRLRQVLLNLLSNACKFSNNGGTIKLEIQQLDQPTGGAKKTLRFLVHDSGIGIDDDKLDSIFEPFTQVDSTLSRNYDGTGLGLALVKKFVELHSGRVSVVSQVGAGSKFIVDLPCRQVGVNLDSSRSKSKVTSPHFDKTSISVDENKRSTISRHGPESARPTILLAEDNECVSRAMITILKASSFNVVHADNGKTAVELTLKHSPELILMDIQMPVMDGIQAIREIRAVPEFENTPIIALSGFATDGDSNRCLAAGANTFISKPCSMQKLLANIRQLITENVLS